MIEINLLPAELRKKEARFQKINLSNLNLEGMPVYRYVAGFFLVLIVLQIILFFIGVYSRARLGSLDKRYDIIMPKNMEAIALKIQAEDINNKARAIDELMVKRFKWTDKLNALSDSVTAGIWLSELSYDERLSDRTALQAAKGPGGKLKAMPPGPESEKVLLKYLIISGYASSMGEEGTALVGKFIKSLKDNPGFYSDFSDIELGTIRQDRVEGQEVMGFKITCLFKETH